MKWNRETGRLGRARARELGLEQLLDGYLE
jgi:hypothetical protein